MNLTVSPIYLRELEVADEISAKIAHFELAIDDFKFLLDWEPEIQWIDYIAMLHDWAEGKNLPDNRVRSSFKVAIADSNDLVGRISVRYELNYFLENFGGHIGYGVRPQFRRRGFATEMLKAGLADLHAHGIERGLVTCLDTNTASAAVLEQAGGVFEDMREHQHEFYRRYWFETKNF